MELGDGDITRNLRKNESGEVTFISQEQVFVRIVEVKDIYSFAEYLGAVVRDIIPGYHSEMIQKTEKGAHHDSDWAQAQPTILIPKEETKSYPTRVDP